MQLRKTVAAASLALIVSSTLAVTARAQVCECKFPESNESGSVAGAFGGGLFAGLVAAVLHIKHTHEASLQPRVDPFTADPVGVAPVVETATGEVANSDSTAPAAGGPEADRARAAGSGPASPHVRRYAAGRPPRLTADEAMQEGLVPPKTATMMPAYALIGLGSLLLGLFLVRQRTSHRRRRY
ncbi:MAG TPA: LPXTG cell wall anchor domain-containing protein [Gemmatimonadaceae bacterium]|nr:LPXTG cell wall anchor domain-containing protein [Gemmatimonadaceae bacterium]